MRVFHTKFGEGTVKVHLAALFRNLGVRNRTGAVAAAVRLAAEDNGSGRSTG